MHEAYCKLGFSEAQRTELYAMLAFVMTLWNLSFLPGKEGSDVKNPKVYPSPALFLHTAHLLSCTPPTLIPSTLPSTLTPTRTPPPPAPPPPPSPPYPQRCSTRQPR